MWDNDKPGEISADNWQPLVRFTGTGSAYFFLLVKTVIFSLITLGIYSFWGRTLQRRYLWEQTLLLGEPLEYTGTGKELFVSFIIVAPVLLISMFVFGFVALTLGFFGWLIVYIPLVFLWQFATYRALRFRLTRTRWRGIRGNMSGSAILYGLKATGYLFAVLVSLGLLYPWASGRMASLILNNVWFGNRQLGFSASTRPLYRIFLLTVLGGGILAAVLVSLAIALAFFNGGSELSISIAWLPLLFFVLLFFVCSAFYRAAFFRWLFEHARFGEMRTRSTLSGAQMFYLTLTNLLLIACTLGLGTAWATIRGTKIRLHSVLYTGEPRLEELLQDTREAPKSGEGLASALDVDIAL